MLLSRFCRHTQIHIHTFTYVRRSQHLGPQMRAPCLFFFEKKMKKNRGPNKNRWHVRARRACACVCVCAVWLCVCFKRLVSRVFASPSGSGQKMLENSLRWLTQVQCLPPMAYAVAVQVLHCAKAERSHKESPSLPRSLLSSLFLP